jgi:cyclopropane-fatty-acyl-phospholipid synthase
LSEEHSTLNEAALRPARHRWADSLARTAVLRRLDLLPRGSLRLRDPWGVTGGVRHDTLTVDVHHPRAYRRLLVNGSIGAAEGFIDGDWDTRDLTAVCRLFARHSSAFEGLDSGAGRALYPLHWLRHRLRRNTRAGSKRNIHAHYDLGNEFFATFLDDTLAYSAAWFAAPNEPLEAASRRKFDRLCRLLELRPHDRLLEIGCGWGGFAIHAAREYGCRVTAVTISREQHRLALERVHAAGLLDRIEVRLQDYRDVEGTFDKIASIEMIEAVGNEYFPAFFRQCQRLLAPSGLLALQTITIPDRDYEYARRNVDFIKRYVFPGGALPSVGILLDTCKRHTDFALRAQQDFAEHYAQTLNRWHERFLKNIGAVRAQGFDERFIRLWRYYLSYCEAGFAERLTGVSHLVFARPEYRPAETPPRADARGRIDT